MAATLVQFDEVGFRLEGEVVSLTRWIQVVHWTAMGLVVAIPAACIWFVRIHEPKPFICADASVALEFGKRNQDFKFSRQR